MEQGNQKIKREPVRRFVQGQLMEIESDYKDLAKWAMYAEAS